MVEKEIGKWNSVFQSSCAELVESCPISLVLVSERERQGKGVLGLSGECSGSHTACGYTWDLDQATTGFLGKRICCI